MFGKKNVDTYQCFYCPENERQVDYEWADGKYFFFSFFEKLWVQKYLLPNYIPLQDVWIQALDGFVGYSDGYLVLYPFLFPVDVETFQTVQKKWVTSYRIDEMIPDLKDIAGNLRRPRFQNGGVLYDKYLGDDKNWVYYWVDTTILAINRVNKLSDFSFVSGSDDLKNLVEIYCAQKE